MEKQRSALRIPSDTDPTRDYSRPEFVRPIGQVGIYLDIYDAEPVDAKAFGTKLYFMRQLADKFFDVAGSVEHDLIKGAFERRNLLASAIIEDHHVGNIISVSFEDPKSLEELWKLHKSKQLQTIMQEVFILPQTAARLGAKFITLQTRLWEDEYDACRGELKAGRVPTVELADSEKDQAMIRKIKQNQPKVAEEIMRLKDDLNRFDQNLGEFILVLKTNVPENVKQIKNQKDYEKQVRYIKEHRRDKAGESGVGHLEAYGKVVKCAYRTLRVFEDLTLHSLLQVHASCENPRQQDLKRRIRKAIKDTKVRIKPDYPMPKLEHLEWSAKILPKEQELILGLISLLPIAVDAIAEADAETDEYLSGLSMKIRV